MLCFQPQNQKEKRRLLTALVVRRRCILAQPQPQRLCTSACFFSNAHVSAHCGSISGHGSRNSEDGVDTEGIQQRLRLPSHEHRLAGVFAAAGHQPPQRLLDRPLYEKLLRQTG